MRNPNPILALGFFFHLLSHAAADTITPGQLIGDGLTVVSSGGAFELGFFSLDTTNPNRYVGIWYKDISVMTPVWVANRESPLTKNRTTSSAGFLTLTSSGQLVILDSTQKKTVWSSNTTGIARNPVVQLLDSGNLVIREAKDENYLWQSFDHPTDTLLPGMWLSWNPVVGRENYLSSWRTYGDPSQGDWSFGFSGYRQIATTKDDVIQYRMGPWNGIELQKPLFTAGLRNNDSVVYFTPDKSVVSRFTLVPFGVGELLTWIRNVSEDWSFTYSYPGDVCDTYQMCGPQALCNPTKTPVCFCLSRFIPKNKQGWLQNDWSAGCIRRDSLNCTTDVFYTYSHLKFPYSQDNILYNGNSSLEDCKSACLTNCSCMAYAILGSGCMRWFGDLLDLKFIQGANQEIYIRMSVSELESDRRRRTKHIAVLTSCPGILLLCVSLALFVWKRKRDIQRRRQQELDRDQDFELPMYDLSMVTKATDNFSDDNRLGEGGFGPVYKGIFENGMQVAVKRLSKTSSQGPDEFKNEVICIAKLQHRNLVKLLGCCIQGHEKILVYEYMPNKSLDLALYGMQLDWSKRFHIINGVARGILYLHQDSQLRIIHRDLKASNVLLDNDLNPKISDFGMARIFGGNETAAQTRRVVGTYGYMSPEYAGEGLFSIKSDVYSFGVLVLEIMSGQRNRGFQHEDHNRDLIGHAWILQKEGMPLELVDPNIVSTISSNEIQRSIHVALLCVQQRPEDRPNMATVVLMLGSGGVLPEAREPGFFTEMHVVGTGRTTSWERPSNGYTITLLEPR